MGSLIQTTSFRTDFEAMVYLRLFQTGIQTESDCEAAYEKVLPTCVKVNVSGHYGSGSIWDINEYEIIIVTNRHVLEYWNEDSFITFIDGLTASGELLYLSDSKDLGFVRIPLVRFSYEELLQLRCVRKNLPAFEALEDNADFFAVSTAFIHAPVMYQGEVFNNYKYIEDFKTNMLYAKAFGKPGMSGGGMFDAHGNYIAMTTGGTVGGELAGVALPDILLEYTQTGRSLQN